MGVQTPLDLAQMDIHFTVALVGIWAISRIIHKNCIHTPTMIDVGSKRGIL